MIESTDLLRSLSEARQDHNLAWPLLVIELPGAAPSPDHFPQAVLHHGLVFPLCRRDCWHQSTHRELQVRTVQSVVEQGSRSAGVLLRLMLTKEIFAITDIQT